MGRYNKEYRRELTAKKITTLRAELHRITNYIINPNIEVQLSDIMHLMSTLSELRTCNEMMEEL